MAPAKDKWVRRFIIPETARHKKGFTIYKITSVVFLKSSHEEVSKVSVWKRYNDFKKLHSELSALHSRSQIKEKFPTFPKSKYFGRFEAEVIEERRESALKFLDFIGRHSLLYSSDIFIKFFETSHSDHSSNDCSQSLSSDTSEDDRQSYLNSISTDSVSSRSIFQHVPKCMQNSSTNLRSVLAASNSVDHPDTVSQRLYEYEETMHLNPKAAEISGNECKVSETSDVKCTENPKDNNVEKVAQTLDNDRSAYNRSNSNDKNVHRVVSDTHSARGQMLENVPKTDTVTDGFKSSVMVHDGSDLPQSCLDSSQYILIAAAHMSAAFKHEAISEYEEAFTQYKMGISSLLTGVQTDADTVRADIIKEKISKYLERAEKLYNRHLNCNISLLNKPVSELQYYKVLKIMKSVMLVKDIRQNCLRIVKAIEKLSGSKENISNYILRGQVPHMVRLHACIETETTVFLILDHISRGKLWDFIIVHYTPQDNTNRVNARNIREEVIDCDDIVLCENYEMKVMECEETSVTNSEIVGTTTEVQVEDHSLSMELKREMYTSDVSTMQLVEKAQMLLQSVNETLKESNSVANRLRESKHLMNHQDSTTLLNRKNATRRAETWDIILTDVNKISSEGRGINETESRRRGSSPTREVSEKSMVIDTSKLSGSCKDLAFRVEESPDDSVDDSTTIYTHFSKEQRDGNTDNVTDIYDFDTSLRTCCKIESNEYVISEDRMEYFDTALFTESGRNNNIDDDQELWTIPENVVRLWAAEILLALEALHQQEVIVFDFKPDNVLVDDNGHVQLTYIVPHHDTDLSKHKQPYASPELCMFLPTVPLTPATDIWSFGVILYELIVGNRFQTRHPGLFHSHSIISIPNKISENAKSLLLNVLKYEPNERLTIPEIKQHPFFEDTDWASMVNQLL